MMTVYTSRMSTFKIYVMLKVPSLFDNGKVQSPWIIGVPCFIVLHFIVLHRCCLFYKLKADRPFTGKMITTRFVAAVSPPLSPRYVCGGFGMCCVL